MQSIYYLSTIVVMLCVASTLPSRQYLLGSFSHMLHPEVRIMVVILSIQVCLSGILACDLRWLYIRLFKCMNVTINVHLQPPQNAHVVLWVHFV